MDGPIGCTIVHTEAVVLSARLIGGRYILQQLVGHGGVGLVYRAIDQELGQSVAVKLVETQGRAGRRFQREVRILEQLSHPAIVRAVGHGEVRRGLSFLAMEWLEGETLYEHLAKHTLSPVEALTLIQRIAGGLAHAHDKGVLHRDLKPSNIFLVESDVRRATLIDFGVARSMANAPIVTGTGTRVGTAGFMAPEQAEGRLDLDERADIFALGCVLFEALTGVAPFAASNEVATLARVLLGEPPWEALRSLELPRPLVALVESMLEKDRARRPGTISAVLEVLSTLDELASPQPPQWVSQRPPEPPVARDWRPRPTETLILIADAEGRSIAERTYAAFEDLAASYDCEARRLTPSSVSIRPLRVEGVAEPVLRAVACALALSRQAEAPRSVVRTAIADDIQGERLNTLLEGGLALLDDASEKALPEAAVIVDATTAELIEGRYELLEQNELRIVLGPSAPIAESLRRSLGRSAGGEFEAKDQQPPSSAQRSSKLFGRGKEIGLLTHTWIDSLCDETRRSLLVVGDPGSGKTCVVFEALHVLERDLRPAPIVLQDAADPKPADRRGWLLWIDADPCDAGRPLSVARSLLRCALGLVADDPPEVCTRTLEDHWRALTPADADPAAEERNLSYLAAFVQHGADSDPGQDGSDAGEAHDPEVTRMYVARALLVWLGRLSDRAPLLVVLDDLQWADRASLELIDRLLAYASTRPFLLLGLGRTGTRRRFVGLPLIQRSEVIRLDSLPHRVSDQLARFLEPESLDEGELVEAVERAAGNPRFLQRLLRNADSMTLPESIVVELSPRFAQLDSQAQQVLAAGACLGDSFIQRQIVQLLDEKEQDVATWLKRLIDANLLRARPTSHDPADMELVFHSSLYRHAMLVLLDPMTRRAIETRAQEIRDATP